MAEFVETITLTRESYDKLIAEQNHLTEQLNDWTMKTVAAVDELLGSNPHEKFTMEWSRFNERRARVMETAKVTVHEVP